MAQLKAILNEAADRHAFDSPARGVKALKQKRTDVQPFTIEEANVLIATVREDYRPYLTVRFLTGLRAQQLPAYEAILQCNGWHMQQQQTRLGGLLISELWQRSDNADTAESIKSKQQ